MPDRGSPNAVGDARNQLDRMNPLGASLHETGVTFRVWAPRCRTVEVVIDGRRPLPMTANADGIFETTVAAVGAGARYQYRLDGERYRPDPVSRWQPEGVHGSSVVVDPRAFAWTDQSFHGHDLGDLVFYELHVGTFTRMGTFEAIVPRLGSFVDLGVTAIELMPVAEFPGSRNWVTTACTSTRRSRRTAGPGGCAASSTRVTARDSP